MDTSRRPVWIAGTWAVATALLGAALTDIGPWYYALRKPWFQPPDWLFGPAWTVIFALAAWAFVRAWRGGGRGALLAAYAVNGLLNAGWSWLFFGLGRPGWALAEVIPLWLSILAMLLVARRHDAGAAWLLAPYLAWVSFAAVLNWRIVALNGAAP